MIKKTLTYKDFNGNEITEDFYFNMNKVESTKFEAKYTPKGYEDINAYLSDVVKDKNFTVLVGILEDIILGSYGVKSPDGKKFIKNQEVREEFEYSNAYADLFEKLVTNVDEMKTFAEGVLNK